MSVSVIYSISCSLYPAQYKAFTPPQLSDNKHITTFLHGFTQLFFKCKNKKCELSSNFFSRPQKECERLCKIPRRRHKISRRRDNGCERRHKISCRRHKISRRIDKINSGYHNYADVGTKSAVAGQFSVVAGTFYPGVGAF